MQGVVKSYDPSTGDGSVVSDTTINAVVPANACNGYWRATSLNGTGVSPTPFTVG